MRDKQLGPGRGPSQEIGDDAKATLNANKPRLWSLNEITGSDYGYDYQVTAFAAETDDAQCTFNIQLKGTTQRTARIQAGEMLSHAFDLTTLTLWHRSCLPVLVVIADLIDSRDPKLATAHFYLANDDVEELIRDKANQSKVNMRVPVRNLVHRDLDILPEVLPYLETWREAARIVRERRRARGSSPVEAVVFDTKPAESNARTPVGQQETELEFLIESSAQRHLLLRALGALRQGEFAEVLSVTDASDVLSGADAISAAIAAHLRYLAFDAIGDDSSAGLAAEAAHSLAPDLDFIQGARAQRELEQIPFGDSGTTRREMLLSEFAKFRGVNVAIVMAKTLALDGKFEDARKTISTFPKRDVVLASIVVSIIERNWPRAIEEISDARTSVDLRPRSKVSLALMESRAHFETSLTQVTRSESNELVIPAGGLPGIDYKKMREAHASSHKAMLEAQRLNWPVEVALVLDVFCVSSMLLGEMNSAIPLLVSLGHARHNVVSIREIVSKFSVRADSPGVAVELYRLAANGAKFEDEDAIVAIALLKLGMTQEALDLLETRFAFDSALNDVRLSALMVLGLAAHRSLRSDLLTLIRRSLMTSDDGVHCLQVLDAGIRVEANPLERSDALHSLYEYWTQNGKPQIVGHHLVINGDANDPVEAKIVIVVASVLLEESALDQDQIGQLGQAHIAVGNASDAIRVLEAGVSRFVSDAKLRSLLGIALDLDGRPQEAFDLLGTLLSEGVATETARRFYVDIAVRMGFTDEAIKHVRNAYLLATSHSEKLRMLNLLFQLLLASDTSGDELEDVSWEYGKLARKEKEREEGMFLQQFYFATSRKSTRVDDVRMKELSARLDAFTERFPDSRYLRRVSYPESAPPEEMLAALRQAVGLTDDAIRSAKSIETRMDRGLLAVPFAWRPKKFLTDVADIFMLWELRKKMPQERGAFHFSSAVPTHKRRIPNLAEHDIPVLSLTSILVLDELDFLETLLGHFPRVVIARSTLRTLQEGKNAFTSAWGQAKATRIVKCLQNHFGKISHPPTLSASQPRRDIGPEWHLEEKTAVEQPRCFYFSDDVVETILVCGLSSDGSIAGTSMSTAEFASRLGESHELSRARVAEVLAGLVRLKIFGFTVEHVYFIQAVGDIGAACSYEDAESGVRSGHVLAPILDGVWDYYKPFEELLSHFAANLTYLIGRGGASEYVLVALWQRWLQSVRFQATPSIPPLSKLILAFWQVLSALESDSAQVARLWSSFWKCVGLTLGNEIESSEDEYAIKAVGTRLGRMRADPKSERLAMALFEKAQLAFDSGTARSTWFETSYIEAMVARVSKK